MKTITQILASILTFFIYSQTLAQEPDSVTLVKLHQQVRAINSFYRNLPQEKVYLHLDNTSYYQNDNIWFKCYVVHSERLSASQLSKTLYVELLNAGGEVIAKQVLKIENGQCNGSFTLNRLPFYSGFYEVRAYTRYMLNFDKAAIFSRLVPVFETPKQEGRYTDKKMLPYRYNQYPMLREKPQKERAVNLKFFPESGHSIQGLESRVAFQATDAFGLPIELTGRVVDGDKNEVTRFSTLHQGMGCLNYTPLAGQTYGAVVDFEGKQYNFDLPAAQTTGVVIKVDNISLADSIAITVGDKRGLTNNLLGLVLINGGKVSELSVVEMSDDEPLEFKISKTGLLSGVSHIVLFDAEGNVLGDRMIFVDNKDQFLNIEASPNKKIYEPYEPIVVDFEVSNQYSLPVATTFSLSIRDGQSEVQALENIKTSLLLMSEIRGYVSNPAYYFQADDAEHRSALDLLLMVQGWRRYEWPQITGREPFDLKYTPEQGIQTNGQVVSFVRGIPKANVEVSAMVTKKEVGDTTSSFADIFVTDSLGRFSFTMDLCGRWNMVLSVREKGKAKDHRILLDRLFTPELRRYRYADLQVTLAQDISSNEGSGSQAVQVLPDSATTKSAADILPELSMEEKTHYIETVVVKGDKRSRAKEILNNKARSIAFYDVNTELDNMRDKGLFVGNDMNELMVNMNAKFQYSPRRDYLIYNNKLPLFVVNYRPTMATELDYNKYKTIRPDAVKAVYVNQDISIMARYADYRMSLEEVSEAYGCVVFIETYSEDQAPADLARGVRKTWIDGYSQAVKYFEPDYSSPPIDADYRRTLYWNPTVATDSKGKARVRLYNNGSRHSLVVSAETVTARGVIGVSQEQ